MSVRLRNKLWHYDVTVDGKRVRGSTGKRTEGEAVLVEDAIRTKLLMDRPCMTAKHYIDSWNEIRTHLSAPSSDQYVYLVQMGNSAGPIKIGLTGNVDERMRSMQTLSPFRLTLVACIRGNKSYESALHQLFSEQRLEGEWFKSSRGLRGLARHLGVKFDIPADCTVSGADNCRSILTSHPSRDPI